MKLKCEHSCFTYIFAFVDKYFIAPLPRLNIDLVFATLYLVCINHKVFVFFTDFICLLMPSMQYKIEQSNNSEHVLS